MFARKTILALAALTALGTAALTPSSASAWGRWGGHWGGYWGGHWGHWGGWGWGHRWGGRGWGPRWGGWGWGGWHGGYCAWHRCGVAYPATYYGGAYAVPTGAYAVPTGGSAPTGAYSDPPRPGPGCLAKGYTPDGNVVFTDRCTQESAVASSEPQPAGPPQGDPPPRH
jgi:hypothetical protein